MQRLLNMDLFMCFILIYFIFYFHDEDEMGSFFAVLMLGIYLLKLLYF